ncbi:RELT-like protein 2 isoform X2 [Myxocyprinus asiaticus]|uniref:RELT-like protein 2 isoform X2 n=1 Tax=Myxocyprinus asiaticus TaxID=70543 RepID=UPI002223C8FC|nr:RELT-like protein 2 isoform X2 [Myxocyprinus asiaticus]
MGVLCYHKPRLSPLFIPGEGVCCHKFGRKAWASLLELRGAWSCSRAVPGNGGGGLDPDPRHPTDRPRASRDVPNTYESEDSQDTVEQILKCIIENEANMDAFKEMLGGQNVCELHDPRLRRKDSVGGLPLHHHTVHLGGEISTCVHCMQGHLLKTRRRSRVSRSKARPGEMTVFSVGRFRVTHTEKKNSLQGSINLPAAKPGDTSNDTTLSDSRSGFKDTSKKPQEEYNIRNMFKDTGGTNGKVPNPGKRKKSVTLLGFYKGSSPVGTKEMVEEDKEGPSTAEQLSVSLEECLSSVAVSLIDTETALDVNSIKGSVNKLEETSPEKERADEASLDMNSQDKLSTKTTGNVRDGSRFSVVSTEEEITVTSVATTEHRGCDTVQNDDIKTGKISQENIDNQQV